LQLESSQPVRRKDVVGYVFLGEKCIDCVQLSSAGLEGQEAGLQTRTKKVKIPLFSLQEHCQIILKRVGSERERFGSISFSLKKLAAGMGSTFCHWVTLFDSLDDDAFDGALGQDDYDLPRVLLEYSVCGGKYTSAMSGLEQLKEQLQERGGGEQGNYEEQVVSV